MKLLKLSLFLIFAAIASFVFLRVFNESYIVIETSLQRGGTQQFFFDKGRGFNESDSRSRFFEKPYMRYTYRIPISLDDVGAIRVDPSDTTGWTKFYVCAYKPRASWRKIPLVLEGGRISTVGIEGIEFESELGSWTVQPRFGQTDSHLILQNIPISSGYGEVLRNQILNGIGIGLVFTILMILSHRLILLFLKLRFDSALTFLSTRLRGIKVIFCGCLALIPVGLVLLFLITRSGPDYEYSILAFELDQSGVEHVQLRYDLGSGLSSANSRMFWNSDGGSELDVVFRIPAKTESIRAIQIGIKSEQGVGVLQNMKLSDFIGKKEFPVDLRRFEFDEEPGRVGEVSSSVLSFIGSGESESIFYSDDLFQTSTQ